MKKLMTEKGFERFVFFSDAVVAFALTLLVVPLTDLAVDEITKEHRGSILNLLAENFETAIAFVISFVVVIALWNTHRSTFERVKTADYYIARLNSAWLFTVICIPFATQLIAGGYIKENVMMYASLVSANTICIRLIDVHVMKHRDTLAAQGAEFTRSLMGWITPITSVVIIGIIASVPASGQYALLLLGLDNVIASVIRRVKRLTGK
ncbi:DUF1211 domain-containing membrane protein [Clostridia bacterium]|nr:DUF1211 domain-containing membrane protein [Clostridia bacterium]